jgi:hypothetical protein
LERAVERARVSCRVDRLADAVQEGHDPALDAGQIPPAAIQPGAAQLERVLDLLVGAAAGRRRHEIELANALGLLVNFRLEPVVLGEVIGDRMEPLDGAGVDDRDHEASELEAAPVAADQRG